MNQIVSIHSFRGGTGKSNLSANLASCLAKQGKRVAVVDSDIQSPGIHVLFGVDAKNTEYTLNDYLWGDCAIEEAATDVSEQLGPAPEGALFLIPARNRLADIAKVLKKGYDFKRLNKGLKDLVVSLDLDFLFIDTHPGLNEETLLSISISDALLVVMRPDKQDFQGTAVTIEVAKKLKVGELYIVVNKALSHMDRDDIKVEVAATYDTTVAGVLPLSMAVAQLASGGVFVLREPEHPVTREIEMIASRLNPV